MKTVFVSLLFVGLTACLAQAGGFGGPPPFTNGSPLITGVDGSYQASIRGSNLSGVLRFTYINGIQTADPASFWVIFYEGQVLFGSTTVMIDDGGVYGVFEGSVDADGNATFLATNTTTNAGGTTTVTYTTNASGYFNGSIDNNSPNGAFSGNGEFGAVYTTTTTTPATVTTSVLDVDIKVKGVRVTTTTPT